MTRVVLPDRQAAGFDRIVDISAVAAHPGGIVGPHHAACMADMLGMPHSDASLLADLDISADAVSPALIEPAMTDGKAKATPEQITIGRLGHVQEVHDVTVMLVTNGHITGPSIHMNGSQYTP